MNYRSISLFSL
jgi:hypothetical protein